MDRPGVAAAVAEEVAMGDKGYRDDNVFKPGTKPHIEEEPEDVTDNPEAARNAQTSDPSDAQARVRVPDGQLNTNTNEVRRG